MEERMKSTLDTARCQVQSGAAAEAAQTCRDLLVQTPPEDVRAVALEILAAALREQGDIAGAVDAAQAQVTLLEQLFGADHPHVAAALHNLALLLSRRGLHPQALHCGQREVDILRAACPAGDVRIADALVNFSSQHYVLHHFDEAESLLREALRLYEQAQGRRCMGVSTCLNNLGRICENRGEMARGVALHAEASSIRKEILGMHKDTAFSLGNYGAALAGNEQWQEAASVLMDAIVMYSQLDMDESPYARACRENLDVCRRATMKPC